MNKIFVTCGGDFDKIAAAEGLRMETFEGERGHVLSLEQLALFEKMGVRVSSTRGTNTPGVLRAETLDYAKTSVSKTTTPSKEVVVVLIAERGKKFEETGQCIASHAGSIVFLPRSAKPGEQVRVRLSQVVGKVDARNRPMYQAEYAWPEIPREFARAIAETARILRRCNALPQADMRVILRAQSSAFPPEWTNFGWFYFGAGGTLYGSPFSPAALSILETYQKATEMGLVELTAWLYDKNYYNMREKGQVGEMPAMTQENIIQLVSAPDVVATKLA